MTWFVFTLNYMILWCPTIIEYLQIQKFNIWFDGKNIEMNIICPNKSEYKALVDLWEASVRASHDFLSEEDIQYYKPLILEKYLTEVELRCAKNKEEKISGFIGISDNNIEMLFVSPNCFGQGVGKLLLQCAFKEFGVVKVDVNEQNVEALNFYEHMGFVVTARSPIDSQGKSYPLLHMKLNEK